MLILHAIKFMKLNEKLLEWSLTSLSGRMCSHGMVSRQIDPTH